MFGRLWARISNGFAPLAEQFWWFGSVQFGSVIVAKFWKSISHYVAFLYSLTHRIFVPVLPNGQSTTMCNNADYLVLKQIVYIEAVFVSYICTSHFLMDHQAVESAVCK
jgi:hypothetical protein